MPKATITIRSVKNEETGLDLSVPNHKVGPSSMLSTSIQYNLVVVSNLADFKSAEHTPSDVVQYVMPKNYADFENFRKKLSVSFSGTVLPSLPKSLFAFSEFAVQERRTALDKFVKFVASTPKLASCSALLEFLGVSAKKVASKKIDEEVEEERPAHWGLFADPPQTKKTASKPSKSTVLATGRHESDSPLFTTDIHTEPADDDETETLAAANDEDTSLFVSDMSREEEDGDFGVPMISHRTSDMDDIIDVEDDADLLNIDDNLDKLLTIDKSKPTVKPRPVVKPKPTIGVKPQVAPKPKVRTVVSKSEKVIVASQLDDLFSESTDLDEISKYIQQNELVCQDNLDLFS